MAHADSDRRRDTAIAVAVPLAIALVAAVVTGVRPAAVAIGIVITVSSAFGLVLDTARATRRGTTGARYPRRVFAELVILASCAALAHLFGLWELFLFCLLAVAIGLAVVGAAWFVLALMLRKIAIVPPVGPIDFLRRAAALREYAHKLGPALIARYGTAQGHSVARVRALALETHVSRRFLLYACAMFADKEDFQIWVVSGEDGRASGSGEDAYRSQRRKPLELSWDAAKAGAMYEEIRKMAAPQIRLVERWESDGQRETQNSA